MFAVASRDQSPCSHTLSREPRPLHRASISASPPHFYITPRACPLAPQKDQPSAAWQAYLDEVKGYEAQTCKEYTGVPIVK